MQLLLRATALLAILYKANADFSLTILHTSNVRGNVLPVHGGEYPCNLVPPANDSTIENCYGSSVQNCVVEVPTCMEEGLCTPCAGGMAGRVKFIEDVKREKENVLVLDTGNFFFGTQWLRTFKGNSLNEHIRSSVFVDDVDKETELLYDAMGLAAGELGQGTAGLAEVLKNGPIPRIMSNYKVFPETSDLARCRTSNSEKCVIPYKIIRKGGVDIGVFGMSPTDLATRSKFGNLIPIETAVDSKTGFLEVARNLTTVLESQGVNVVVVMSSMSMQQNEQLALEVPGIDVIVASTSPRSAPYRQSLENLQSGSAVVIVGNRYTKGQSVGQSDLTFSDDGVVQVGREVKEVRLDVEYAGSIGTDRSFNKYTWEISKLESNSANGNFITVLGFMSGDAQGQSGNAKTFEYRCAAASGPESDCSPSASDALCCPRRTDLPKDTECCPTRMFWEVSGCRHSECPVGRLVADAMLAECFDCDVSLFNSGGIWGDIAGTKWGNDTQVTDLSFKNAMPHKDRVSTFKLTAATLIQVLQHALRGYHPAHAGGKFLQVAGLRLAWNAVNTELVRLDLCAGWDRNEDQCAGEWQTLSSNSTQIVKVASVNFLRAGGDGFDILVEDDKYVFEANDFGVLVEDVLNSHFNKRSVARVVTQQELDDSCGGFVPVGQLDGKLSGGCRIVRTDGESPFACPRSKGEELRVSHPEFLPVEGASDDECSGFGFCNPDFGYRCDCKNGLLDGFEFPDQYYLDLNSVQAECGQGEAAFYPGVALARGPACDELRTLVPLGTVETLVVCLLGVLCFVAGTGSLTVLYRNREHPVVRASQPVYLYIVCIGVTLASVFCFLSAVEPTFATCNAIPTVGAVAFSLVIMPLVVKTQIILSIFINTRMKVIVHDVRKKIAGILLVSLMELGAGVALASTVPFRPTVMVLPSDGNQWSYSIICRAQNSQGLSMELLWTIPLVGVNAMIVLAATFYAFQTRKVPDVLSDSKYVGFAVYNILVLGGTLIPLMFLVSGNPGVQLVMRVVAVSVSMVTTLLILVLSKMYLVKTTDKNANVLDLIYNTKDDYSLSPSAFSNDVKENVSGSNQ